MKCMYNIWMILIHFVSFFTEFCECTHMLEVDIGDVVEMWFIDEGIAFDVSHPFHMHGTGISGCKHARWLGFDN